IRGTDFRYRPGLPGCSPSIAGWPRWDVRVDRTKVLHPARRTRETVEADRTGRTRHPACRDGADPQRMGPGRVLVSPTRGPDLDGAHHPVRGPARLLLQAHQKRPPGLQTAGPTAAAAPRRATRAHRRRARRTAVFQRLDALLELLGPAWYDALGSNYGKAALALLARYADPHSLIRVGHARLTRFLIRHSRGAWREQHATMLLAAAQESLQLWGGAEAAIDFAELAADIAVEAQQAQMLTEQIEDLDERCANLYAEADPTGIIASAPGVGPVTCAVIAGRIGDPHRFHSLAAIRSYSGLVPKLSQSGQAQHQHGLTKAGDPLLREALFAAADQARKTDPQLAAKYKRLMATERHHDSAICHIATTLLTRIATCWRTGEHYNLRDTDGRTITPEQGRQIVRTHHGSRQADPHQSRQYPPVPAPQRQDGPRTKGVAKRSGSPARQHEHKHCRSRLTPLRNSRRGHAAPPRNGGPPKHNSTRQPQA